MEMTISKMDYQRKLFGRSIKVYRAQNDLTQDEMAARCKICRRALQKAETGQPISYKTEIKIIGVIQDLL